VTVTLWGQAAEEAGAELEALTHALVSISACRVTDYNGAPRTARAAAAERRPCARMRVTHALSDPAPPRRERALHAEPAEATRLLLLCEAGARRGARAG